MNVLPITLIGGYLGAGKTTLLNHLLATVDERVAVLMNDVGDVNIDAALVAAHTGATIELTNGCVCCAIGDELGAALETVRGWEVDRVVVELSGVAEPARTVPWTRAPGFEPAGIVTVADAVRLPVLVDDRFVGDTVRAQLAAADVVILTKTDLVDDDGRVAAQRAIAAGRANEPVDVIEGTNGQVAPGHLLDIAADHGEPLGSDVEPATHRTETVDVSGFTYADLERYVATIDAARAKGLVRCRDRTAPIEVQVVGERAELVERPDLDPSTATDHLILINPAATQNSDRAGRAAP